MSLLDEGAACRWGINLTFPSHSHFLPIIGEKENDMGPIRFFLYSLFNQMREVENPSTLTLSIFFPPLFIPTKQRHRTKGLSFFLFNLRLFSGNGETIEQEGSCIMHLFSLMHQRKKWPMPWTTPKHINYQKGHTDLIKQNKDKICKYDMFSSSWHSAAEALFFAINNLRLFHGMIWIINK